MYKVEHSEEWFKQAYYDIASAKAMFDSGKYIYCVFMCHLSIEKALKALYMKVLEENPPKTHSLVYLAHRTKLKLPLQFREFLESLDEVSVPTRYPDELDKLLKDYGKNKTRGIFVKTKEALSWIEKELEK